MLFSVAEILEYTLSVTKIETFSALVDSRNEEILEERHVRWSSWKEMK